VPSSDASLLGPGTRVTVTLAPQPVFAKPV
jgi:hypothetical protein